MKISKLFSLFVFGLLVSGIVQAQETDVEIQLVSEEPVMTQEMEVDAAHKDCPMMKKMGERGCGGKVHGDCPMKKMMGAHHGGVSMILFKLLRGLGCLLFLFLGAFVVRKGWEFKGICCGKSCKK